MKTRQAVLVEPRRFELREVELTPGPGQILVKVAVCGLCNWEQNHWKGLLGQCPQTLGHEWSGVVKEVGAGVTAFKEGDQVTGLPGSLTGFSDYIVTRVSTCVKLAPHINPADVPGEPLKCIVTVLRGVMPEAGDVGVVVGCGPMGLWCIQGLAGSLLGALIAVDVSPLKLALAEKFGATHTVNPKEKDAAAFIRQISEGRMANFVIEGTGVPEVVSDAVKYLKERRGRLALMSAHERPAREFDWRPVQDKGAMILGTHPYYSLDEMDDMRRAVTLLNRGVLNAKDVISHRFPLKHIQKAFETCECKPADYIKGVVIP